MWRHHFGTLFQVILWRNEKTRPKKFKAVSHNHVRSWVLFSHCQNVTDHFPCLPNFLLLNAKSKSWSRTDEICPGDRHVKFKNNTSGRERLWDTALKFLCPGPLITSPNHLVESELFGDDFTERLKTVTESDKAAKQLTRSNKSVSQKCKGSPKPFLAQGWHSQPPFNQYNSNVWSYQRNSHHNYRKESSKTESKTTQQTVKKS